jgi:hypothetical protein
VLSALRLAGLQAERPVEEVANDGSNLGAVRLQREMAGVEKAEVSPWDVALERFGSSGQKKRVVFAPHRQKRRLVILEIPVEFGVEIDIAGIVEEQIELHLVGSRACQIIIIQRATIRRYKRGICDAVGVLEARCLWSQEAA